MSFADNLKKLPGISHLAAINLLDADGNVVAAIENKASSTARVARARSSIVGAGTAAKADSTGTSSSNPARQAGRRRWRINDFLRSQPSRLTISGVVTADSIVDRSRLPATGPSSTLKCRAIR